MLVLLLKLFLAHVLGDFVFQKQLWLLDKQQNNFKSKYLYLHITIHGAVLLSLLQVSPKYWLAYLVVLSSHFLIDGFKSLLSTKNCNGSMLLLADQALHGIVILALVNYYTPFEQRVWQVFRMINQPEILLFFLFLILITFASGIVIKQILSVIGFKSHISSYKNAGTYIGILERLLIFICVISGFIEGIGYLLAAKSIFRFGDLTKARHRSMTEYVLIGTLLSFTSAILFFLLKPYPFPEKFRGPKLIISGSNILMLVRFVGFYKTQRFKNKI